VWRVATPSAVRGMDCGTSRWQSS